MGPVALCGFVERRSVRPSRPCSHHERQQTCDGPRTAAGARSLPWQREGCTAQIKLVHVLRSPRRDAHSPTPCREQRNIVCAVCCFVTGSRRSAIFRYVPIFWVRTAGKYFSISTSFCC